jgi:phenylacetate-CoA ligase
VKTETDIDLTDVGIKRISVYGEPGGSIPEVVKQLSEGFGGVEVYDLAGGTSCLNPIFASCEAHDGMHFIAPDHAYIEILDPETGKVLPIDNGVEGEFVYTGLDRECGPLIRFKDGDRMVVNTEPCTCGMPGWRVNIKGRVDDMLLVKGVNVFPSAIQDVVRQMSDKVTGNMRIVKYSDSPVIEPPLQLKVECVGNPSDDVLASTKTELEQEIQRNLRFKAEVELFCEDDLKMEYGATGKVKLIEKAY